MGAQTHILIVDADSLMRDGLSALLNLQSGLQVIGAVGTSAAITRALLPTAPDLIILDIDIPDFNGMQTIAAIHDRWPLARVLVLTFQRDEHALKTALQAGVNAYVLKSDTRGELFAAMHNLMAGRDFVSQGLMDRPTRGRRPGGLERAADGLSERERDVLKRIAQGRRTREIANELSLSHKTIEKYRSNLMRKLGLRTATAVAAYAITHGYVEF
jgi:two-component system, LuxR family, secretion system response regulator SsrB